MPKFSKAYCKLFFEHLYIPREPVYVGDHFNILMKPLQSCFRVNGEMHVERLTYGAVIMHKECK